ncbi:MAG: hypothetical protein RBS27_08190 [Giesbergeria sp.]|jgi:hypothetical protein|nr:hypothetical protein [Giesbergeria sp.]
MHSPHAPRNEPLNWRVGRWFTERPALQIGLCAVAYGIPVFYFGAMSAVLLSPVFAALLVRPLLNLASNLRYHMRAYQLRDSQGRYYEYKGHAVHVAQGDDGERWILLSDVCKIIGPMSSERALQLTYPGRLPPMGRKGHMHIRADALVTHLGKHHDLLVLRFRNWVERTLAAPGHHVRATLGDPTRSLSDFLDDALPPR